MTDAAIGLYNGGGASNARQACASVISVTATFDNMLDEGDAIDCCLAGIDERKPRWA